MTNEDGTLHLVFNGEIYNYLELREELVGKGHRFTSTTDSEVILHQYEEDGEDCLRKFNGMFSLALWDGPNRKLFAARDRLGIKPLYYYLDSGKFLLASEIKAILEDPEIRRAPDHQAIADYLYAGRSLAGRTMFQDIKEVEPGYSITVNLATRESKVRKYWDIEYRYDESRTEGKTVEELFSLLDDAVAVHCRSDAPLGCHLSGGVDSSSVVAFAARHRSRLPTFTIKFSDEPHIDESKYAKAVAGHVGAEYHECRPTAMDLAETLPFLVWHMDIPMATDGGFAYFTASRFAKEHVKVSLTGHGGDEIFGGYPAQFQTTFSRTDMFRTIGPGGAGGESRHQLHRRVLETTKKWYRVFRNVGKSPERKLEDLWISLHCGHDPGRNSVLHPNIVSELKGYSPREDYISPFREARSAQVLDKCLYHDMRVYLPSLLHLEDRVSMAVSLESRVPLLDYRIVEFLATVPPARKIDGMVPKHLLRKAASTLLPDLVVRRMDKFPFPVPRQFWNSGKVKEMVKELILSDRCRHRGIFQTAALEEAYRKMMKGDVPGVWQMLNVELWFRIFIDQDPRWIEKAKSYAWRTSHFA
jgi:asparagine synthase (glutamine-hydrolysing)